MKISAIIIALNEEAYISECITSLKKTADSDDVEIILVDGGSTDATLSIAADFGIRVIQSKNGRGHQCRKGAEIAIGDVMVFLHGDSRFPPDGIELIQNIFKNPRVNTATFRTRFDPPNKLLKFFSWFSRFDSIFSSFGDQGIVVRKDFYEKIGGFPPWKMFEDVDFLRKARKRSRIVSLPAPVITSTRRFRVRGIIRTQIFNLINIIRYRIGVPVDVLSKGYKRSGKEFPLTALGVMIRYPVPGKVKTRLARTVGDKSAHHFYQLSARHCMREIQKVPGSKPTLIYTGTSSKRRISAWMGPGYDLIPQKGKKLGERLDHASGILFRKGFRKVILIGSDVPDVTRWAIEDAVSKLNRIDVVLGPCHDGGYYLIGTKSYLPQLYENITWSTPKVLDQTISNIKKSGLSWALLPELIDVDTEEDLKKWYQQAVPEHPVKKKLNREEWL